MDKTLDAMYRELLSRIHREILKPAGFKKEGGNFRLCHDTGLGKIVNFQRSMYNDQAECKFAINVGLYFQKDVRAPNLRFKEYDCPIRQRAACFSPRYGSDHWWCIFEDRDMESLYCEVRTILTEDVLPWMTRFESRQDVIRAGQNGLLKGMIWGDISF